MVNWDLVKNVIVFILISNRSIYCNQRLSNIYSHVYLRVLSPTRPYQALTLFANKRKKDFKTFTF